ncbi:MAG: RNA polymerase sigma factor [Planctomycetota bacterium]|nr:RNA polymerase sigma factor [Planctomycetota bacterium]
MPHDRDTLLRTARGDPAAARTLWASHAPVVRAFARAVLGAADRDATCDDVVQNTFCRVLETPERTLASVENVRAWLLGVARHLALTHARSAARERRRRRAAPAPGTHASPDQSADIARAVEALPRRLREPVVLRHVAGLSFDQIALSLDIPRTTAFSRYQLALDTLRGTVAAPPRPARANNALEVRHA